MRPIVSLRRALDDPDLLGSILGGPTWLAWRAVLLGAMGEALSEDETRYGRQWAKIPGRARTCN
jgi:hypothetical protein